MDGETRAYLDQALGSLRQEFVDLRQEVRDTAAETRRHFDVVGESLRQDIRAVAEGVAATTERMDRIEASVKTEMEERFAATHSIFRTAFHELRRDIDDVRSRL
jgi:phage host-nuclease inhibitor protein Gam